MIGVIFSALVAMSQWQAWGETHKPFVCIECPGGQYAACFSIKKGGYVTMEAALALCREELRS